MSRIAYVAGQYLPHRQAAVHIEDRGYQFGDGVYEVIAVTGGRLVDEERHLGRLHRSLTELRINPPMNDSALKIVIREVVRRNGVDTGIVYLQVTRGVAPREHAFPKAAKPVLVVTSRRSRPPDPRLGREGIAIVTIPDIRWQRCDIKSVALVANVLGKQQAREASAYEAWQVDGEGQVTEGTSTNAWIVTVEDTVYPAADHAILNGVTRAAILDIIQREGYRLIGPFTVAEARTAREAS
jgi:D-alanine transaminase